MRSPLARRGRAIGLVPILLVAVCAVVAVQTANSGHAAGHRSRPSTSVAAAFHRASSRAHVATTTTTSTTAPPTTTTTSTTAPAPASPPAPAPTVRTTTPPPPPPALAPAAAPSVPAVVPARGEASVWGCAAAVAYLSAYSYPGFTFECPGNALGREGMTCLNEAGVCPGEAIIAIADACPAAYMNEASNSWVLEGRSNAPIDPYGTCP
jgi:hypothetical protein